MFTKSQLERLLKNATPGTDFYNVISLYLHYTDIPAHHCAGRCGATDNLTMGYAAGNEVWLCPRCKRLEEMR